MCRRARACRHPISSMWTSPTEHPRTTRRTWPSPLSDHRPSPRIRRSARTWRRSTVRATPTSTTSPVRTRSSPAASARSASSDGTAVPSRPGRAPGRRSATRSRTVAAGSCTTTVRSKPSSMSAASTWTPSTRARSRPASGTTRFRHGMARTSTSMSMARSSRRLLLRASWRCRSPRPVQHRSTSAPTWPAPAVSSSSHRSA